MPGLDGRLASAGPAGGQAAVFTLVPVNRVAALAEVVAPTAVAAVALAAAW